jgi:hypothetical protein
MQPAIPDGAVPRHRRTWRSALVGLSIGMLSTTGACGGTSSSRPETVHPIPVKVLSHQGLLRVQTSCGGGQCHYSADLIAATDLMRLRELAWASGSRPDQHECAVEPGNAAACWTTVTQDSPALLIAVLADAPCTTSTSVTAELVSQQRLRLQVTNSGQCQPGAGTQQQPHLSLLLVPIASLPATLLTVSAERSANGTSSQIGQTVVDLRSPPGS